MNLSCSLIQSNCYGFIQNTKAHV
uniref:Uncharacterized protein n=1 Tax=Anguilla anguilla TaxID=7936 RepID=A0A0E9UV57_ANGAN